MDRDGQLPIGASLVRKSHQLDKNKGQEQRREEVEGRILVAGDAVVGAGLLARQFQIDLVTAGDVADVLVLEHLQPAPQPDDDAASDIFRGLLEDAVRGLGRVAHRQNVKQGVQLFLVAHRQQLVNLADVLFLRRIIATDVEDQGLEQIEFGIVPEMIAPLAARVFNDHIAEELGHQLLALDLRKTVPGVRGGGRHQIEHADGVTLVPQVLAGLFVQLGFGIGDDHAGFPRGALQDHIDTEGPGLFRAGCSIHGDIAVEPGVFRDADHLAVQFPQDRPVVFADVGHQIQDALQLLAVQKSRRPVGALVGVGKIAGTVIFPGVAVAHPHDHQDQQAQKPQTNADPVETVGKTKGSLHAGEKCGVRQLRRRPAIQRPAGGLPHLVVIEELGEIPAAVEQGGHGEGQGNQTLNEILM